MPRSAYGHLKYTQITNCLSTDELKEFEWLSGQKRLTKEQADRMGVLWAKAEDIYTERIAARKVELAEREERIQQYEREGR